MVSNLIEVGQKLNKVAESNTEVINIPYQEAVGSHYAVSSIMYKT